jgi:hypothetical protein
MCKKLIYLTSFILLLGLAGNAMAQLDPAAVDTGHVYLLNDINFVDGTVPDDSAVGLAGNIIGEPYLAEGLFGRALLFDGVDDGVHIPDSQFINVTGGPFPNRTVVAVFNCAHVDKPEMQTVFEEGGRTRGLTIYVHEGLAYVGGWNRAEYQWNPGSWISAPISSNEWHTVAFVIRDGTDAVEDDKFEMWMDGELIGKAPGGQIYNHGNDNSIGYTKQNNVFHDDTGSGDGWFFEGLVDEVWILNEALTPPELAALAGTTWPYAYGPDPANGAELEEFSAFLEWGPGDGAVSHDVYLGSSLDDVIAGAADTFLGNQPTTSLLAADLVPETTYYWRVDEVNDADPNNPSTAIGEVWSFSLLPRRAYNPDPADGVRDAGTALNLTWTPGWSPIMHQVYFGTDPEQVANAADAPLVMDVGYDTGDLHPGTTYYWRVDEFYDTETVKGPVWTFTTIVYDEETPFDYDNSVDPFISEVSLDLDPAIDLTDPIGRIAVNYTGAAAPGSVTVDEAAGTTTVVGRGDDIWGTADEFQYAFTTLTGDGSMTVKVESLAHSHDWSKAGIMIRETLDPGSVFAMIAATGTNGVRFQARMRADQDAESDDAVATDEAKALTAPVWIKIERVFPMINAYYSTDGVTFIPMGWNSQVIPMTPAPIHIGLAVTSHSGAETYAEAVFSEISSDGGVAPGPLTSAEIGLQGGNAAEPMYLVLEDASGASAAVLNPDAAATQQTSATDFVVDLRNVAIDRSAVTKISLIIGDVDAPAPGGSGSLTINNVRLMDAHEFVAAFAFGSRLLDCPTYNDPAVNYTMVLHESVESVQYDAARGYGYEVIYPVDSPFGDRSGYGVFGPFDDSPNNRSYFGDECPEELYDSFIGAKSFTNEVSAATMGDMDTPSPNPEGIIFRVDVPNGLYRFVGAVGEAENHHAHRVLAEDGGSGPPANIGANSVVLVSNHDQAQQTIGEAREDRLGAGVFARVGFDGKIPPPGDGVAPSPQFVDMDENGMATTAGPSSPILEVTQGYIRIHQLQGNSNDGPGGALDANGGDIVILELWNVGP